MGLINADTLIERVEESRRDNPHRNGKIAANHIYEHDHFIDMIIEAPIVDAEPVVRCKDCDYYRPEPYGDVMMCYGFANGSWPLPDEYCSRGKRKEVANDIQTVPPLV